MDLDLKPGWEKKALIILAVITVIVVVYAYGPFNGNARAEVVNNTSEAPVTEPTPVPSPEVATSNNSTSNITNVTTYGSNGTYQITADQAKKIATESGFTAGEPTKGNIMVNNNNIAVWIVPLMKGSTVSKRVYVDGATGVIVGNEEVKN